MSCPSSSTLPPLGTSVPESSRINSVLPLLLNPTTATTSPALISSCSMYNALRFSRIFSNRLTCNITQVTPHFYVHAVMQPVISARIVTQVQIIQPLICTVQRVVCSFIHPKSPLEVNFTPFNQILWRRDL